MKDAQLVNVLIFKLHMGVCTMWTRMDYGSTVIPCPFKPFLVTSPQGLNCKNKSRRLLDLKKLDIPYVLIVLMQKQKKRLLKIILFPEVDLFIFCSHI